ncbi:DUF2255 family protein [Streptomyces sp. NPDC090088]|uniref:DUF2255 family protein n=1 Tax=Streptomyces sp. NPDC090088 TaxID=3365944 RepID=UPI0037F2C6B2
MRQWDATDLALFTDTDEMQIAPLNPDSVTYRRPTVIWMMVVDGGLYARANRGLHSHWYQAPIAQRAGRITVADRTYEVTFEREKPALRSAVEDAMRTKYAHSPFLSPTAPARTREAGVHITPRSP